MVLSFARKLFAFLSSLWALADIVLDSVTVYRYHMACHVGDISCTYYQLGILFMLLPVIFAMGFICIILVMESGEFESVFEYFIFMLVFGLFYLVVVPIAAIWFTARDLLGVGESEDRARDMEMVKVLKMFEHIGENNFLGKKSSIIESFSMDKINSNRLQFSCLVSRHL